MKHLFSTTITALALSGFISCSLYEEPAFRGIQEPSFNTAPWSFDPAFRGAQRESRTTMGESSFKPAHEIFEEFELAWQGIIQREPVSPADEVSQLPALLYSVEKDGKRHWLFGTTHIPIPLENFYCFNEIEREISNSDQVFVEKSPISIINRLNSIINEFFEESVLETGASFSQQAGLSALSTKLSLFKQLFQTYVLSLIDSQIVEIAFNSAIPIIDLDDQFTEQASALHRQIPALIPFIKANNIEDIKKIFHWQPQSELADQYLKTLAIFYNNGFNGLIQHLDEDTREMIENTLLKDRNEIWLEKFKAAQENPELDSLFLAAGAGHFIGPFNLIDMLIEEGFSIQQMDCGINEFLSHI